MSILKPYMSLKRVTDIKLSLLNHLKIKVILIDIDNTLVEHGLDKISADIRTWLERVREQNIKLILVSNNYEERVSRFACKMNLDFISKANKPLPFKVRNILQGYNKKEILFVGDQIFTDIVFANLLGIKSILLDPINEKEPKSIRLKRIFERPLRKSKGA